MKTILSLFLSLIITSGFAQATVSARQKNYNLENKTALSGYDPVSYFAGTPKEGKSDFTYTYLGVQYFFTSQANLNTFKSNPTKYEPAYGGWCAYAMGATGEKVEVDPETFKIIDGKLYLFYNAYFNNTLKDWNKDQANLKRKADENWSRIK